MGAVEVRCANTGPNTAPDATYELRRDANGHGVVTIDGLSLDPRHDLSSDHFNLDWGHTGPECLQLALALLAHRFAATDVPDSDARALEASAEFHERVVATMPADHWKVSGRTIDAIVDSLASERLLRKIWPKSKRR